MRMHSTLLNLPRPSYMVLKAGLYFSLLIATLSLFAYIALSVHPSYTLEKNACALVTAAAQNLVICGGISVFSGIRLRLEG